MKRIMMLAVAVSMLAMYSWANKVDQKFYEKASKIVWAMELPQFDSKAQVPDSLYANESAVIIACYRSVDVKRVEHSNISKYTTTLNAYTNAIDCKKVMRVMVKLKDAAAVEKFSEFDIDAKDKESIDSYNIMHTNSAFGARVYKADGQVNDVDCSEVFTVTEGKKDKAMKHKIAIPGLEPGDVLEYFYYDEIWLDELDLDPIQFPFFRDYPTINYTIRCSIDPQLTVEYRSYNGAPLLFGSVEKDGTRILQVETSNLPKNDEGKWQSFARQEPFIDMRVLNNMTTMVYRTPSARRGGVYCGLNSNYYFTDISHVLSKVELPLGIVSRATKRAKDFQKAHPDITSRQLIDAAWLAVMYEALIDKDSHNNLSLSLYMADVMRKLKVKEQVAVGVINSRFDVPVTQILHWRDPDYMVMVGDSCYMLSRLCYVPGELPGEYEAEEAAVFYGDRKDYIRQDATVIKMPTTRAAVNNARVDMTVSINADDDAILDIERKVRLQGSLKRSAVYIGESAWVDAVAEYLGVPEKERNKLKEDVDTVEVKQKIEENIKEDLKHALCTEPRNLKSYNILSQGVTPDAPNYEYVATCDVDGLVKRAGKDVIVSIGKLIGDQVKIEGSERQRTCGVVKVSAKQTRYVIKFVIPDGYVVNEASLEALNRNVANACGAFYAQATVQGQYLVLQVNERYSRYAEPVERWPHYLQLLDASAEFNDASLVLTKQ